jgi:hypothetical protein
MVKRQFIYLIYLISCLPAKLLYSLKDPKTGNTLYLSNFPVVIPGSTYLKQHNIRAVLSVIQFDKFDGTDELAQLAFLKGKDMHKVPCGLHLQYNLAIADRVYGDDLRARPPMEWCTTTSTYPIFRTRRFWRTMAHTTSSRRYVVHHPGHPQRNMGGPHSFVLLQASVFLDKAIQNGNVIVHCKEGQRRHVTSLQGTLCGQLRVVFTGSVV